VHTVTPVLVLMDPVLGVQAIAKAMATCTFIPNVDADIVIAAADAATAAVPVHRTVEGARGN
jgi:hypothetical protein